LAYEGFGANKPKARNETEEGRAINRRVEFIILEL
jgi:flagellar motor protein MotB